MANYRINYIDGHDLRYKSFETVAKTKEDALSNLWAANNGDFDHQIAEIIKLKDPASPGMRIGEPLTFHVPYIKQ